MILFFIDFSFHIVRGNKLITPEIEPKNKRMFKLYLIFVQLISDYLAELCNYIYIQVLCSQYEYEVVSVKPHFLLNELRCCCIAVPLSGWPLNPTIRQNFVKYDFCFMCWSMHEWPSKCNPTTKLLFSEILWQRKCKRKTSA